MVDPAGGLRYNLGALGNGSRIRPQQAVQDRMGLRDGMWGLALHGVCLKRELKMSNECCRINLELWYTGNMKRVRACTHTCSWLSLLLVICYRSVTSTTSCTHGVCIVSVIDKCYTSILNIRLYDWLDENKIIPDVQAGFSKEYPVNNWQYIFTLCHHPEGRSKPSKLYACFVDLKMDYDSAPLINIFHSTFVCL